VWEARAERAGQLAELRSARDGQII
jgi:hypothetical protein